MTLPAHVVVVGMMGAGKTSIGRALAERLRVPYADNDDELRARTGRDAATVARDDGVATLHTVERAVFEEALRRDDGSVVAAPGSVALDEGAPALLADQHVVWLRARPDTLAARVVHDSARPLLGDDVVASMAALAADRDPVFARLADIVVDVDGASVDDTVGAVCAALRTAPPATAADEGS